MDRKRIAEFISGTADSVTTYPPGSYADHRKTSEAIWFGIKEARNPSSFPARLITFAAITRRQIANPARSTSNARSRQPTAAVPLSVLPRSSVCLRSWRCSTTSGMHSGSR